jgi:hypothetical protein
MLALSAAVFGGAGVGGNGLHASVNGGNGGMTIGSASFGEAGVGSHEFGHTLQFIALAGGNKKPSDTWKQYVTMGAIGLAVGWTSLQAGGAYDAWYNPWEFSASLAGGGFL